MREKVLTDGEVFRNNRKAHFQILVGAGETVQLLAKASSASDYSQIGEDFTTSVWFYAEDLPFVDMKFVIPTNSEVIRVSAVA